MVQFGLFLSIELDKINQRALPEGESRPSSISNQLSVVSLCGHVFKIKNS